MWQPAEEPPDRQRLERPGHRDPLAIELQRDRQGHEAQGDRGEEREVVETPPARRSVLRHGAEAAAHPRERATVRAASATGSAPIQALPQLRVIAS